MAKTLCLTLLLAACGAIARNELHVYNWANYISPELITEFERKTGIAVVQDVFDSEEMLDAKLSSGAVGYDLVFPASGQLLHQQIKSGLYAQVDKSRIDEYANLLPVTLAALKVSDENNNHAVPFMWTATAIGYDSSRINDHEFSLGLLFDPVKLQRFSKCGAVWFSAPQEIVALSLMSQHLDPNVLDDSALTHIAQVLKDARPHVWIAPHEIYSEVLANGSACIAIGWLGEIALAAKKSNWRIRFAYPIEGGLLSVDAIAIPKSARNVDAAYKFINFLLRPVVSSKISNEVRYMSANARARGFGGMIAAQIQRKNTVLKVQNHANTRRRNRIWTSVLMSVGA